MSGRASDPCEWPRCRRPSDLTYGTHRLCDGHYADTTTSERHARWPETASAGCGCETCFERFRAAVPK